MDFKDAHASTTEDADGNVLRDSAEKDCDPIDFDTVSVSI